MIILAFFVLAIGLWWVYTVPPGKSSFHIPCVFLTFTGYFCAGCGITRALHLLLHGHLWAAFRMNPLVGLMAAAALCWLAAIAACRLRRRPVPVPPTWVWLVLAGAILLYTILRNIPVFPFTLLAPLPLP